MSEEAKGKQYEFKAEIKKLLGIITHSLYTHREIFLRELVSNASDALDKLRFAQSKGEDVLEPDTELAITIRADADAGELVITDTGVGMTRDELVANIGTIARSGSEEFLDKLTDEGADLGNIIGRFGVGFYSVFMVADRVTVRTRSYKKQAKAYVWTSDGLGSFTVDAVEGDVPRGTEIRIKLKEDAAEYLEKNTLETVLKKHSSFIAFPIQLEGERVNTIPALWREPKFSVTPEQYEEFYSFLTFDPEAPLTTIHTAVDAPVQFNSLIFVPKRSFDPLGFDRNKYGLDLYVRRVLIQRENKDLIPEYLGFCKGVVDTEDLPLNISRETLQENVVVRKIGTTVTKQILSHLEKLAQEKPEDYAAFWKAQSRVFKLGYSDYAHRDRFAALLRFNSSIHEDAEGLTSLEEYTQRAKEGQKEIYYVSGPSREAVKLNPHVEIFRKKGVEVLYLYEPIDEFAMDALRSFGDFALTPVEHAESEKLDAFEDAEDAPKAEELAAEDAATLDGLLAHMQEILGERVTEIRESKRLTGSACCLVSPDGTMSSAMQKILQTISKETAPPQKAMEINRDHPLVRNLIKIFRSDAADPYVATVTEQLYESALMLEGYLTDPHAMVERINRIMEQSSGWYAEVKKV